MTWRRLRTLLPAALLAAVAALAVMLTAKTGTAVAQPEPPSSACDWSVKPPPR